MKAFTPYFLPFPAAIVDGGVVVKLPTTTLNAEEITRFENTMSDLFDLNAAEMDAVYQQAQKLRTARVLAETLTCAYERDDYDRLRFSDDNGERDIVPDNWEIENDYNCNS